MTHPLGPLRGYAGWRTIMKRAYKCELARQPKRFRHLQYCHKCQKNQVFRLNAKKQRCICAQCGEATPHVQKTLEDAHEPRNL